MITQGREVKPGIYFHGDILTTPHRHWTEDAYSNTNPGRDFGPKSVMWSTDRYVWLKVTDCPTPLTVYSKGKVSDGFRRQAWVVGCSRLWCEVCKEEKKARKRAKWAARLREMINYYAEIGGRVIFKTLTVHDKDYPDGHEELRLWVQKLLKRLRADRRGFQFKYWVITEEGSRTGRLHAHLFFFLTKGQEFGIINDTMDRYWERWHRAYVTHYRPVSSGKAAAGYATKYATKAIGLRVMSSKFGWTAFMNARRSKWLDIDEEGVTRWVVVDEDERKRTLQGVLRRSPAELSRSVTAFTVIASVVAATPTLSPLKQVDGGLQICGVNEEPIGMLTMSGSRRLLPETCILLDSSPYVQARRLQVFGVVSTLHRTLLTTSTARGL